MCIKYSCRIQTRLGVGVFGCFEALHGGGDVLATITFVIKKGFLFSLVVHIRLSMRALTAMPVLGVYFNSSGTAL